MCKVKPKYIQTDAGMFYPRAKALWSAPILLMSIVIQNNFIEDHCTTNEVQYKKAGVNLGLGENRWLDFIRLSNKLDLLTDIMNRNLSLKNNALKKSIVRNQSRMH